KAFIAAANLRVEDPRGRVEVFAHSPAGDRSAPLADLTRPSRLSYLVLAAPMSGRYWIEDERGVRTTELHKEAGRPVVLAVSPGEPYFIRSPLQEARFGSGGPGQLVDAQSLGWKQNAFAARGSIEESFRDHLFETPFGAQFYGGFVTSSGEPPVAPPAAADLTP
ncbi:MAG: hypothetical protein ACYC8T_39485, partial [Myxococcaceae bacterium]